MNKLLYSILSEPWMILPEVAESYKPMIMSWLNRGDVSLGEEKEALTYMAAYASRITPDCMGDIDKLPQGSIAIVQLSGPLTKYDGWCNYGSKTISNLVRQLAVSGNVSGIVLDIDGPGGAANAVAPMVEAIQFVQQMGKPIVVHADMIASAHYYIGVYADKLYLDNYISSQAGSIGVMVELYDNRECLEKYGIKIRSIKSSHSATKNLAYDKAMDGDYELMRTSVLDPMAIAFQEAVRQRRGLKLVDDGNTLSGSVYYAKEAIQHGLVDGVMTLQEVIALVNDLVEVNRFMGYR